MGCRSKNKTGAADFSGNARGRDLYLTRAQKGAAQAGTGKTRHHVLDTIAAMVSGSRLPPGRKAISYIKRWSVGSPVQAPLDALSVLMREHRIKAEDVERVTVRIASFFFNTVNNNDNMPNVCLQYLCAVMLLDSVLTFEAAHSRQYMKNKRVREMRGRIELIGDEALTKIYNEQASRQGGVEILLTDGRTVSHHTRAVSGTPENPMIRADVDEKAFHLMAPTLGRKRARAMRRGVESG